jgi:hypothetical protein
LRLDDGAVPGLAVDPIERGQPGESGSGAGAFLQRSRGVLVCLALGLFAAGTQVRSAHGAVMYLGDQKGGTGGNQVQQFDATTGALSGSPNPLVTGYSVEGIDVMKGLPGGKTDLYIGDFTNGNVHVVDAATGTQLSTIATGTGQASLRLSQNSGVLYAMAETAGGGTAFAINTTSGAIIRQVAIAGAHDVVVLADGSVLIAAYSQHNGEVFHYSANLATKLPDFIKGTGGGGTIDNQLTSPTGMVVDKSGNIWISDFTDSLVNEYSSKGTFLGRVRNQDLPTSETNWLLNPVGLDVGADGNIYVAAYGNNLVTRISDTSIGTLTNFISSTNAGNGPKYPRFDANAVTFNPLTPEPSSLVLASMGVVGLGVVLRRQRRKVRRA